MTVELVEDCVGQVVGDSSDFSLDKQGNSEGAT